ncbi:basement membrane-specific heparan sulfate proteoglycan core protein-like [Halichondria panicea]|uniref:basement membrane-specific heparan sulfate proteoglycan core protein-like n=1 Tax=Halichondria panicea TaxID=6063 RepID=UPI00312B90DE
MSNTAVLSVIIFFTAFVSRGISIPTSRPRICSSSETLIFRHGETLRLECGSYCSSLSADDSSLQFNWTKKVLLGGNPIKLEATTGPVFTMENAMFRNGGEYGCQCSEGGQECSYNVSVLPLMTFKASDDFIHHGDTFDLTCIISGFPSNFSRITSKQTGNQLSHHVHKRLNESTTRSYVPVFHPEGNVYVCEAESYFDGKLVAQLREEVTVDVYDPPSIIYTTEFIISKKEEFGKSGQLTCTVQKSSDTSSFVSWFAKGVEITNNTKYSAIILPVEEEDIIRYQLTVSDLQETDIGSYLCRLSSTYGIEDMQEAWIQVDYRKDAEAISEQGSTHSHGITHDKVFAGQTSGQNNILFFAFCGLLVLVAMVILWKMSTGQGHKALKKRPSPPGNLYRHGNEDALSPTQNTTSSPRKHC